MNTFLVIVITALACVGVLALAVGLVVYSMWIHKDDDTWRLS